MSERTGAVDAQIKAAINRWLANPGSSLSESEIDKLRPMRIYTIDDAAEILVPPGMVIARDADVLTTEQRAAIRTALYALPELPDWNGDLIDPEVRATLRSIVTGGTE